MNILPAFTQDKILKFDNTVVEGKILNVDDTKIELDPAGEKPFIIVARSEVKLIIYDDNTVVSFEEYDPVGSMDQLEARLLLLLIEELERISLEKKEEQNQDSLEQVKVPAKPEDMESNIYGIPGSEVSYGLESRKVIGQIPHPDIENCNITSRIIINIEIQVDQAGKVVSAIVSSATFADNCIWNAVLQAARMTKFNKDQKAAFKQSGWIRYTIEP